MPASLLTADCIWNSFRNSGKRHLFLTGTRGSGKTTLFNQLFPQPHPGLTTWAQPRQAVYLRDNLSGQTVRIGIYDETLPGPGNQMALLKDGFTSLGIPVLMQCMESGDPWITIDEIGYLEAQWEQYQQVLRQLLEKKQVAAVIRKQELSLLQELSSREDVFCVDLDDPFGNIGCVIMASGLAKRFGSNKLLADFHGQPMITRILEATEGIFQQRVVVTRSEEIARLCRDWEIQTILHNLPYRSDTVRLGLESMTGVERCMFVPSDQPLLRRETIAALAFASARESQKIWRVSCGGIHGTPVVFPEWSFPELRVLPEGKGGGKVIKKHPESLRTVGIRDSYELKDVDKPGDLEELLKR